MHSPKLASVDASDRTNNPQKSNQLMADSGSLAVGTHHATDDSQLYRSTAPITPIQPPSFLISPDDGSELVLRTQLMQRMIRLALETDSTRIVALVVDQNTNPKVNLTRVHAGHHSLPHHGQRADSV